MRSNRVAPSKFFPMPVLSTPWDVSYSPYSVILSRKWNRWYRTHISLSLGQSNMFDVKAMPSECFKLWKVQSPELKLCNYSEYLDPVSKYKTATWSWVLHNSCCLRVLFGYSVCCGCNLNAQIFPSCVYCLFKKIIFKDPCSPGQSVKTIPERNVK